MNLDGVAHRNPQNVSLRRRIGARLAHGVVVEIVGSHKQRHASSQPRERQREIGRPLLFRHTSSKASVLRVFGVAGERGLVEQQLLRCLQGFHALFVVGTVLKRVFDRVVGVLSAFLQIGFVLDVFLPVVANVLTNRLRGSGFEGRERFNGKNVFVLATVAEVFGVEILGGSS